MIESSDEPERRQMTERRRLMNDNDALMLSPPLLSCPAKTVLSAMQKDVFSHD